MIRVPPRLQSCRVCHAKPGDPCVVPISGERKVNEHVVRQKDADLASELLESAAIAEAAGR